jgi:hypothetical protein
MAQEKILDILSLSGEVLFSIAIRERITIPRNGNGNGNGNGSSQYKADQSNGSHNKEDEPVTGPQLKLLFRIYAGKGIIRDSAQAEIKKLFGVTDLADITKFDAMKKIDSLLKEAKGGNGKNGSFIKQPN